MNDSPKTFPMDLTEHFRKEPKPYSGPRPFHGMGIADRPPAPPWRETLGRFLSSQLSTRPAIRWEGVWSGAPTTELNDLVNRLCEKSIIRLERHQTPGLAAFWTLSRGLSWNPDEIIEEVVDA